MAAPPFLKPSRTIRKIRYLYDFYPEAKAFFSFVLLQIGQARSSIPRAQSRYRSWSRLLRTRPSALPCVFYMMRVMEVGVQRLGKKLGVSLTAKTATKLSDLSWHQILDALNPKLKALPQKTVAQKDKYEKYAAIKKAIYMQSKMRGENPTMHPRKLGYRDIRKRSWRPIIESGVFSRGAVYE